MRRAFTLIELIISITILSVIMIFLYQSYSSLNSSNKIYMDESKKIKDIEEIKKIIFLDLSLKLHGGYDILNQDPKEDIVFFQSSNSIHKRYDPYVAYIAKDSKLYRLESLKKFEHYPLDNDMYFDIDELGDIESFRIYRSNNEEKELFLVHVDFKDKKEIILKVNTLNE